MLVGSRLLNLSCLFSPTHFAAAAVFNSGQQYPPPQMQQQQHYHHQQQHHYAQPPQQKPRAAVTMSGQSTVKPVPRAETNKELTALVPASLRVKRDADPKARVALARSAPGAWAWCAFDLSVLSACEA